MRKQAIITTCDGPTCKNYVELESSSRHPADWLQVQVVKTDGTLDNHTFEFCGPKCVSKWASERAKVINPVGNYPCGVCEFVSTTVQGLRMHERNAHGFNVRAESP